MPRDLFQPAPATTTGLARRAGVVPLSIAAHAAAIATAVLVPALAVGGLPDPRMAIAYVARDIVLPVVPAAAPPGATRRASAHTGAPVEAPSVLPPLDAEPPIVTGTPAESLGDAAGVGMEGTGGVPGGVGMAVGELPPPPPAPPQIVRVGGEIRPPVKLHDVAPVYPAIARSARVQGTVVIEAVIDVTGRVSATRLLHSVPLLDEAALAAVRQWVFTPTRLNGEPTAVMMSVTVQFTLR